MFYESNFWFYHKPIMKFIVFSQMFAIISKTMWSFKVFTYQNITISYQINTIHEMFEGFLPSHKDFSKKIIKKKIYQHTLDQ